MLNNGSSIRIAGTGSFLPNQCVTNREIAEKIHVKDSWIEDRTGIKTRYFAGKDMHNRDLAYASAIEALHASKLKSKDIDCIIVATLSPDRYFPGVGADVQANLKCRNIPAFDINCQCNGFVYGLSVASAYILAGQFKRVLLVCSELHSRHLKFDDSNRDLCVLFGDGAGACVLEQSEKSEESILSFELSSDGHFAEDLAYSPSVNRRTGKHDHQPYMNKTSVIAHSSRSMEDAVKKILAKNKISLEEVDYVIPHQSNKKLLRELARRLDLPMEKMIINIDRVGNTSAASIPIALDEAIKDKRIKRGDLLLMVSFGAGFLWGAVLLRY